MTTAPECHCPNCAWEGRYDDADWEPRHEPGGEAWGSKVSRDITLYSCPLCGNDLESGPYPGPEPEDDDELEPDLDVDEDVDLEEFK